MGSEGSNGLRICQVSSCFIPARGGVETFVYGLSRSLARNGHQVKVVTSSRGMPPSTYHEYIDGIEVVRYPERHFFLETPLLLPIVLHAMKEDCDLLHVHGMVPGLTELVMLVCRLRRRPLLITYHYDAENNNMYFGRVITWAYNLLLRYALPMLADRIVVTTTSYAETSIALSRSRDKLTVIPCGVSEEYLQYGTAHVDAGVLGDGHRLLFVGKLHKYKGVKDLLAALKLVKRDIPEVRLRVIGDGRERRRLEALSRNLGLETNVTFHGWVSNAELLEAFMRSDVVVLPSINSRREAFGIVILEAMAMGKPVIASEIPGPQSVIEPGKDGLLVPPESPKALAEAILHLLGNGKLAMEMGRYGREKAARHSYRVLVQEYEKLYSEILEPKQESRREVVVVPPVQLPVAVTND